MASGEVPIIGAPKPEEAVSSEVIFLVEAVVGHFDGSCRLQVIGARETQAKAEALAKQYERDMHQLTSCVLVAGGKPMGQGSQILALSGINRVGTRVRAVQKVEQLVHLAAPNPAISQLMKT